MTQPTPGFEFPQAQQDRVEQILRQSAEASGPVRSVRPERNSQLGNKQPVVPTMAATVSTSAPDPTPQPTAEYVSIPLPSNFAYYEFKDLYVKPFRIPHLAKLAKGDLQSSMQIVAETVGSVIMAPGHANPVLKLSIADLNAVMLWLRLNSFTQKTMLVTSTCDNPEHVRKVQSGELPESSLTIHTRVDATDVEIRYLTEVPDPEVFKIEFAEEGRTLYMRPETVQDAIQFLDHPNWADPEFQYLAQMASVLDLERMIPDRPWNLAEKIRFVTEVLTTDQAVLVQQFRDLIEGHGVVESIQTKCAECSASGSALLSFDARTFLSPAF